MERNLSQLIYPSLRETVIFYFYVCLLCFLPTLASAESGVIQDKVLVLRPNGAFYQEIIQGIVDNIDDNIELIELVEDKPNEEYLSDTLLAHNPRALIILENRYLNAFRKVQTTPSKVDIPTIVLASVYLEQLIKGLNNVTGVIYEIPALISVMALRNLLDDPINRVGVIHREKLGGMIENNRNYLDNEGVALIGQPVSEKPNKGELRKALKALERRNIDALWVVNDNALLNPKLLQSVWLPRLSKSRLPVIVGVPPLIATQLNFGSFCVYPDHYGMGMQAADMLVELQYLDWSVVEIPVQQPLSIKQTINLPITKRRGMSIRESGLDKVDNVVR